MDRKPGHHRGVTRRDFLAGLALSAGATIVPDALGQSSSTASAGSHRFSIAGADIEFWLTPVSGLDLADQRHRKRCRAGAGSAAFPGFGLKDRVWPAAMARLDGSHASNATWGGRKVVVKAEPLKLSVLDENAHEIQHLSFDAATGRVSFDLQDLPVFGLGEGGHQFDRRGVVDAMRNGQFKPDQLLNGGRSPIPWLLSPAGWALFFHHPMGAFDLTGKEGTFRLAEPAQPQDIFLIVNKDPSVLLREFAQLTGLPHLPPLWSLGYQQSHRTLASREEVLQETKTFRAKKLPCDAMIYLGTGFAPSGWNTGHGSYAFNQMIFPDPDVMFHQMHEDGFHVVLHVLGVPHDLHGRVADHSADPDDAANYWKDHLKVARTGIDGWWVDDGDELPPEARLTRNQMYWEGPLQLKPNIRPFSIQRNGYAGLQQYGFLWSGDVNSSWQTLRVQIANGLNTGLSGIPYWGTDTGGFFSTKELTAELYVRWFQFSAFCPLFRSHGRTWMLRLPWGWNRGELGPVEDDRALLPGPDDLHHPEVEEICRTYLNLRYQLLSYLYSAVRATHETGMPLMRALWIAYPGDSRALAVDDAYLWGENLLVAPVTTASAKERAIYLPQGTWFDFWTGEEIIGGRDHVRPVDVATMPLYVKAGTVLPLGPVRQSTGERSSESMELRVYPGSDGQLALYEDDGVSMDRTRGISSTINVRWTDRRKRLSLALAPGSVMRNFTTRTFRVRLAGSLEVKTLDFRGPLTSIDL